MGVHYLRMARKLAQVVVLPTGTRSNGILGLIGCFERANQFNGESSNSQYQIKIGPVWSMNAGI
jgi:hypothetical protein